MNTKVAKVNLTDAVPDYIKQGQKRGAENVSSDDITLPRLCQIQDLSVEHKKKEAAYINGAEPGMLFNNLTRELYGDSVLIIPCYFRKEYIIWKDRKKGGGLAGIFGTELEASKERLTMDSPDDYEVVDTANMFCRVVSDDGSTSEAVLSMSKSKMKISRQLNSLIRLNGGDSFSRVYKISSVDDHSDAGDFYNLSVATAGFPSKSQYVEAESTYESISINSNKYGADYSESPNSNNKDKETEY